MHLTRLEPKPPFVGIRAVMTKETIMPDDPRIQQLLDELLDSQRTPEQVCGSCVELLPVVRNRWRQICQARAELDAMFPPMLDSGMSLPASQPENTPLP